MKMSGVRYCLSASMILAIFVLMSMQPSLAQTNSTSQTNAVQVAPSANASDLLYSDNFASRKESGWSTVSNANVSRFYKDGKYHVAVKNGDSSYWSFGAGKNFKDFVLEVNTTQEGGPNDNDYGVVARYADPGNYSLFLVSGDGFYGFAKVENNQWVTPLKWTKSDALKQGNSTNTLKLVSLGENLTFYANGVKLGDFQDRSPKSGDIGFWVETALEGNVGIAFDDLKVWAAGR
jgi:hypothetical protein